MYSNLNETNITPLPHWPDSWTFMETIESLRSGLHKWKFVPGSKQVTAIIEAQMERKNKATPAEGTATSKKRELQPKPQPEKPHEHLGNLTRLQKRRLLLRLPGKDLLHLFPPLPLLSQQLWWLVYRP